MPADWKLGSNRILVSVPSMDSAVVIKLSLAVGVEFNLNDPAIALQFDAVSVTGRAVTPNRSEIHTVSVRRQKVAW